MAQNDFSLEQLGPYLGENPGRGTLRVQVFTAFGAFPVAGATVAVDANVDGTALPLYRKTTDQSGVAEGFVLPAKPRLDSQRESTADDSTTLYTVTVTHPGYRPLENRPVVIYDGVETLLPVMLEPILR